jgi:lipopolysaccharide transport system ATP-binding protein
MADPIIAVRNIGKKYVLSHNRLPYETFRDTIVHLAKKPFRFLRGEKKTTKEDFWALQHINFDVHRGDAVGLIGANGSGKSTLLKILSQITMPTTGEITLRGKVASLLEVGTGFHPELTGRENIFLNGAILGMTKREIAKKFEGIMKFSGVEKFIDTPVKRYSSGMYVRLAFSVAAHMDPDILIVDEVLAVGDADFQKKCLGKMDQVTKEAGRTVIFVSHNMEAIKKLCTKCILLKEGQIEMFGPTDEVIKKYLDRVNQTNIVSLANRRDREGKGGVKFTDIQITNLNAEKELHSGEGIRFTMKYASEYTEPIEDVRVVITVVNDSLQPVLRLDSDVSERSFRAALAPSGEVVCEVENVDLIEGRYFANIDFLIKGHSRDHVLLASEFKLATDIHQYGYKIPADKTICNYMVRYTYSH